MTKKDVRIEIETPMTIRNKGVAVAVNVGSLNDAADQIDLTPGADDFHKHDFKLDVYEGAKNDTIQAVCECGQTFSQTEIENILNNRY